MRRYNEKTDLNHNLSVFSNPLITRRAEFHGPSPWVNVEFLNAGTMCIQMNLPKMLLMAGTPAFRSSKA